MSSVGAVCPAETAAPIGMAPLARTPLGRVLAVDLALPDRLDPQTMPMTTTTTRTASTAPPMINLRRRSWAACRRRASSIRRCRSFLGALLVLLTGERFLPGWFQIPHRQIPHRRLPHRRRYRRRSRSRRPEPTATPPPAGSAGRRSARPPLPGNRPVSYTHLTLPTKRIV